MKDIQNAPIKIVDRPWKSILRSYSNFASGDLIRVMSGDKKSKSVMIAESLEDPSIINDFEVHKAQISKKEHEVDNKGNKSRRHSVWVKASEEQIERLQTQIKQGWYCHFWRNNEIIAIYRSRKFMFLSVDKLTWKEAIDYGKSIGMPGNELDFPTD